MPIGTPVLSGVTKKVLCPNDNSSIRTNSFHSILSGHHTLTTDGVRKRTKCSSHLPSDLSEVTVFFSAASSIIRFWMWEERQAGSWDKMDLPGKVNSERNQPVPPLRLVSLSSIDREDISRAKASIQKGTSLNRVKHRSLGGSALVSLSHDRKRLSYRSRGAWKCIPDKLKSRKFNNTKRHCFLSVKPRVCE